MYLEIGFSLFDSYVVVNAYIAWKNHILSGRPEKESAWRKYGIRKARLNLIIRWTKRCSRHYKKTRPHKNKRLRLVNIERQCFHISNEAKAKPVKPGSVYHDEPVPIPKGMGACVMCGKRTRWMCFGCCTDLGDIYPVCSANVRDCNQQLHLARNEI